MLNSDKDNGTTETFEELDKLSQILEDKKGDYLKIGEDRDMLREQLKALQHSFNEERGKSDKGAETIQLLQKDLKLEKQARNRQKIQLAYTQIVSK